MGSEVEAGVVALSVTGMVAALVEVTVAALAEVIAVARRHNMRHTLEALAIDNESRLERMHPTGMRIFRW